MDKLAEQLRHDADAINAPVSDELDDRIQATLRGIEPQAPQPARPAWFWWASSLTGVAAALVVLAVLNQPPPQSEDTPVAPPVLPVVDWQVNNAVLTKSLEEELADIESDMKKAEQIVRGDLDDIL